MTARIAAPRHKLRLALVLLAAATAVAVATEFIVVGVLPVLARDLALSLAQTGHLSGAFALAAAVLGPPLTLATASQPPRRVLAGALLVFAAGNAVAALVPSYAVILAARVAQGAALPVLISMGTAMVMGLAPRSEQGRTLALANIGFIIGIVIALPAGVALAETGRWVPSFLVLAGAALVVALPVGASFPVVARPVPNWREQVDLLRQGAFLSHLALSVAAFTAIFAAYTYLAAWLEAVAALSASGVALAFAGFGASGLVGNSLAGRLADMAPLRATVALVLVVAAAAILGAEISQRPMIYALLAIWGAAHMAVITLCQVRVTLAGSTAPAFAMAINIASANLGIALGALIGGEVADNWGAAPIGWSVAVLCLGVAGLALITAALERNAGRAAAEEACR